MEYSLQESRLILAIEALKKDPKLSVRSVANMYNIPKTTLRH
jgi:hypothetical protein